MKKRITRSGNLSTHKESARIRTIKKLKSEVASLQMRLQAERRKALICAVQRDYHYTLVQYLEEYVLTSTPSTFEKSRQLYWSFVAKEVAKYKAEMHVLTSGDRRKVDDQPYLRWDYERRAIRKEAGLANQ